MSAEFPHLHAAHCESGTMAALFRARGLELSEPMVFGVGGGLFFVHLPFLKLGGMPLTAYRSAPRAIIKTLTRRLKVKMRYERFGDPAEGARRLDELLAQGTVVGVQANAFWLSYFPADMRFQYNGHNMVVYGKRADDYLLSDPVFETTVTCNAEDLIRARFARGGPFAPRGLIYYPETLPSAVDLQPLVREAIVTTVKQMIDAPFPLVGVRGIRYLAGRLERWPQKLDDRQARANVGNVVRMQEEIGTGGAGFRFLYAAFLQEAAGVLGLPALEALSARLTETGDRWREFATLGAMLCKGRENGPAVYERLAQMLRECAGLEHEIYVDLRKALNGASLRS